MAKRPKRPRLCPCRRAVIARVWIDGHDVFVHRFGYNVETGQVEIFDGCVGQARVRQRLGRLRFE